jgi:hypothetical protein
LRYYGLWALIAWLLNADVLYARLFLSPVHAGQYAIAFTIGRLPLYAVSPLVVVLLPVTLAGKSEEQRERFWAVVGVAGLLLTATVLSIGAWPGPVLQLLAGRSDAMLVGLVRGYSMVGSLAAAVMLLATFSFALGCEPRLGFVGGLAIVCLVAVLIGVRQPWQLLVVQGGALGLLVTVYGWLGLRATQRLSPSLA